MLRILATISIVCIVTTGCGRDLEPSAEVAHPSDQVANAEGSRTPEYSLMPVGEVVDSYEVRTLDGEPAHIGPSQPITLLNLWATWCAPCRIEFPDLEALHEELAPAGLRLLAVDIDAERVAVLEAFAEDIGLTLTIARDTLGAIQSTYAYVGVPTSFLLARDGSLVRGWTGIIPKEDYPFIETYVRAQGAPG